MTTRGDEGVRALGFAGVFPARSAGEVAEAVERAVAAGTADDAPRYYEVNFFEPHRPYDYGDAAPDDELGITVPGYLPDVAGVREDFAALQGAIRVMDAAVGRIVAALEASGRLDRTLLIFTTDHGLAIPRAKGTLFDAGIEVALIMRWPDGGITGGTADELVSNVDVVPTILDLVGVSTPDRIQGRSFAPRLRGEPFTARGEVFAEKTYHETYEPLRCVRTRTHKLIARFDSGALGGTPSDLISSPTFVAAFEPLVAELRFRFAPFELFDIVADPFERTNLAGDPALADLERDLKGRLWEWMHATGDPLLTGAVTAPAHWFALRGLEESAPS